MEMNPYSLPAVLALLVKITIFYYARKTSTTTHQTNLFLFFVFALSIQNCAEIWSYYENVSESFGVIYLFSGLVYFSAAIVAVALFLHFALVQTRGKSIGTITKAVIYLPMLVLQGLLWFTPNIVSGFLSQGFTYTRIPGSLYSLFALYVGVCCLLGLYSLLCSAIRRSDGITRTRSRWIVFGATPMVLAPVVVLGAQAMGATMISLPLYFPLLVTFFLITTAYATYEHRLFDVDLFIPWSKFRRRTTAFHRRVQNCISALDQTKGVQDSLGTISRMLQCPLAIVSEDDPVVAGGPAASRMTAIPKEFLRDTDDFVVQREVVDVDHNLGAAMKAHHVSAMVRFQSPNQNRVGWLLVGDVIDDRLHSPKDFRYVENLFDRLGEQFLDEVSDLQGQLTNLKAQVSVRDAEISELRSMVAELTSALSDVRELELAKIKSKNIEKEFDIDSLVNKLVGPVITYVGRDRSIVDELKSRFPVVQTFASIKAKKYTVRQPEDILLVHESSISEIEAARADCEKTRTVIAWGYESCDIPPDAPDKLFHPVRTKTDAINIVSSLSERNRDTSLNLDDLSSDFEKQLLAKTLEKCNGSQAAAAKALGIAQNTLHYKLSRHGLRKPQAKSRANGK